MQSNYLNDIINLKEVFAGVICDDMIAHDRHSISWKNYSPGNTQTVYKLAYTALKDSRQFSLLLTNDAIIQFYYQFNANNVLEKAKLHYYPSPVIADEKQAGRCIIHEEQMPGAGQPFAGTAAAYEPAAASEAKSLLGKLCQQELGVLQERFGRRFSVDSALHIRLEYDHFVAGNNQFELQFSNLHTIRIPLQKVISPFLFMDFIVSVEFGSIYSAIKLNQAYNKGYMMAVRNSF